MRGSPAKMALAALQGELADRALLVVTALHAIPAALLDWEGIAADFEAMRSAAADAAKLDALVAAADAARAAAADAE